MLKRSLPHTVPKKIENLLKLQNLHSNKDSKMKSSGKKAKEEVVRKKFLAKFNKTFTTQKQASMNL